MGVGSAAEGIIKMSFGNRVGFTEDGEKGRLSTAVPGTIVAELTEDADFGVLVGHTTVDETVSIADETLSIAELLELSEGVLESVYPTRVEAAGAEPVPVLEAPAFSRAVPKAGAAKPRVLIPVFPGTNCEYDSARAVTRAGLEPELLVLNNQSAQGVADSVERFIRAANKSQIIFLPGGFSGGDEPDGSAKFITAFFRNAAVKDAAHDLLKNRDGLMLGICNGFQALIKLGLVPCGEIADTDADCPTLTYNVIGRHQSKIVRTRIASNRSPWLARAALGGVYNVPISHDHGHRNEADKSAHSEYPRDQQQHASGKAGQKHTLQSAGPHNADQHGAHSAGGSGYLIGRAAQSGDHHTGDNGGDQASGRRCTGADAKGQCQRQRHSAGRQTGHCIPGQSGAIISPELIF